jgi:hypothetical protein
MFAAQEQVQQEEWEQPVRWDLASCRVDDAIVVLAGEIRNPMTELFFSEQLDDIAAAKEICTGCPVQPQCLEGALERREPWGVWGGQLFFNGKVLAQKRKRGRPPKIRPDAPAA